MQSYAHLIIHDLYDGGTLPKDIVQVKLALS